MKLTLLLFILLLAAFTTDGATRKSSLDLPLGASRVRVNVYENAGAGNLTFFAPHYNERIARTLARESVERNGGRLVEIESVDENGNADRYVRFSSDGKIHTVDPNRIYTENGRRCQNLPPNEAQAVKQFADTLLQIIFADSNPPFIVAVHNNRDVDAKSESTKATDLTAAAFVKASGTNRSLHGAFQMQADGVYLSNTEADADNFVFLSTPRYVGHFAELGFNVVVQKASAKIPTAECSIDDGSLSVYAAQQQIQYICLEADGTGGAFRQTQMLEAVRALLPAQTTLAATVSAGK